MPRTLDEPQWHGKAINKEKLTQDDANFLFEQAEKFLKDLVENSNLIITRTSSLITLLARTLVALIGFVISKFSDKTLDALSITAMIGTIYVYVLIYNAFENTKPRTYLIPGALPKDLFADVFFVPGIIDEKRIIHLYVSETENYQFKIEKNNELNKIRWRRYAVLLKATVLLASSTRSRLFYCPGFYYQVKILTLRNLHSGNILSGRGIYSNPVRGWWRFLGCTTGRVTHSDIVI